jgi:hypothetical protein
MKQTARLLEHFPQPSGVVFNYALCVFGALVIVIRASGLFTRSTIVTHPRGTSAPEICS